MRYNNQHQEWIAETCNGDFAFKDYKDALAYEKRPRMKVTNVEIGYDGRIFWYAEYQGFKLALVDEELDDHDNLDGWIDIDSLNQAIAWAYNEVVYDWANEIREDSEDQLYSMGDDRYEVNKYE